MIIVTAIVRKLHIILILPRSTVTWPHSKQARFETSLVEHIETLSKLLRAWRFANEGDQHVTVLATTVLEKLVSPRCLWTSETNGGHALEYEEAGFVVRGVLNLFSQDRKWEAWT